MDTLTHYAILVAINRYPGLSDLHGPENDADAFRQWLVDPDGGNVPPGNVKTIRSSNYAAAQDPYDANPTETAFKVALNGLLKPGGQWTTRAGERLYLFFAGHGFTAGSTPDPALFTAPAQSDDLAAYIAGRRYAEKIANAGFFDEIVLVMDCCQDVMRTVPIVEPGWSPPDRRASPRVRLMAAYGAQRGYKAFETPVEPGGPASHGYFSSVLVDALRTAPPDAEGWVTARSVEAKFSELWAQRHPELAGTEPPFLAPRSMPLYRRETTAGAPAPTAPPLAGPSSQPIELPLGSEVRVFDARDRLFAHGGAGDVLQLPPGIAKVQLHVGDKTIHDALDVFVPGAAAPDLARSIQVLGSTPAGPIRIPSLDSPVPAPWSTSTHEYQHGPAWHLLQKLRDRERKQPPASFANASMLVFARDSAHHFGDPWRMATELRTGFRLRRLADGIFEDVAIDIEVNEPGGTCAFMDLLPAGDYLLGLLRPGAGVVWHETVLHLAPFWRTEVWIDATATAPGTEARQFAPGDAALVARAWKDDELHAGFGFGDRTPQIEALRMAYLRRRSGPTQHRALERWFQQSYKLASPYEILLACGLAVRSGRSDLPATSGALAWLRAHWSSTSSDLAALEGGNGTGATVQVDGVPMLADSWRLLATAPSAGFPQWLQRSVGWWRLDAGPWLQMLRSDGAAPAAVHRGEANDDQAGMESVGRVAPSLDRRQRHLSPLQQSLRTAILAAADDEPDALVSSAVVPVAQAFGVSTRSVFEALGALRGGLA